MLLASRRRRGVDIWPAFVNALAALLMVVIFALLLLSLGQFTLTDDLLVHDRALDSLHSQIAGLSAVLSLERSEKGELESRVQGLNSTIETTLEERDRLAQQVQAMKLQTQETSLVAEQLRSELAAARAQLAATENSMEQQQQGIAGLEEEREGLQTALQESRRELAEQQALSTGTQTRVTGLSAEIETQRKQLQETTQALAVSQSTAKEQQARSTEAQVRVTELSAQIATLREQLRKSTQAYDESMAKRQQALSTEARDSATELNVQTRTLREQLQKSTQALDVSQSMAKEQKLKIENLGRQLKVAKASTVDELAGARSRFFSRLLESLNKNPGIRFEGDRFILPADILFSPASAELDGWGMEDIASVARSLIEITPRIPRDVDWVLRVDGHTDKRPIRAGYASNWELSSARALRIVKFLIEEGIPPGRLVAAGYGEHHPLKPGNSAEAYRHNRRIELKLTRR